MNRRIGIILGALTTLLVLPWPAPACILCNGGNPQQAQTLRQYATRARLVLYGTLANPRLTAGTDALDSRGATEFRIEKVLKSDPFLGSRKTIELPRYVPVDAKEPPHWLVFCDIYKNKDGQETLDPYQGMPVKSAAVVDYLQGILALDPSDRSQALVYFFKFLDHPDEMVANDAYLEMAKANDREIGQVASKLSAAKLRAWLEDPQTPVLRLSLYAFLLGACGTDRDAALLRALLDKPTERTVNAIDGLLCGYIQLRPKEGWDLVAALLGDEKRPFTERFAVLRTLRFYHSWKPEETRREVLHGVAVTLAEGDLADMTIEDLRRWQLWDLTAEVLAQYGKKSHEAPIMRHAIIRYALCCPRPEAARFAAEVRRQDPDLVKDVEETLQFEK